GWNRRPLVVLASSVGRKEQGLPLAPLDDLTAAPLPAPLDGARLAVEGDGPDLLVALAVLRGARPRFTHPLAPRAGRPSAMLADLTTKVGSDVGARVGAGIGAVLGPIGSMLGRYLGEMAGSLGGKAVAAQSL